MAHRGKTVVLRPSSSSSGSVVTSQPNSAGSGHTTAIAIRSATTSPVSTIAQTATLELNLPADAIVYLMGQEMHQRGSSRTWNVPLPSAHGTYRYDVKVELSGNSLSRSITLTAGSTTQLAVANNAGHLAFEPTQPADQFARLIINVPEDATVKLQGVAMKQRGSLRSWRIPVSEDREYGYKVQVSVDNQSLTREIKVAAGKTTSLEFQQSENVLTSDANSNAVRLVSN